MHWVAWNPILETSEYPVESTVVFLFFSLLSSESDSEVKRQNQKQKLLFTIQFDTSFLQRLEKRHQRGTRRLGLTYEYYLATRQSD